MLESLFSSATTGLELGPLAVCVVAALALGLVLAGAYCVRNRHTGSLVVAIAILPAAVTVVIALVNGNVGAGVAVAGAFSLVRFRSVPGSARDIAFIFLAMSVGLACGMGYVTVAVLATVLVGGACVVYQLAGLGRGGRGAEMSLRITIPEDLDYAHLFDDVFERYLAEHELARVSTANMGSVFRLTYDVRLLPGASEKDLIDEIRCRNGNLEVALAHRPEEVTYAL